MKRNALWVLGGLAILVLAYVGSWFIWLQVFRLADSARKKQEYAQVESLLPVALAVSV